MPSIEDFTGDLYKGVRQVTVPKALITELSSDWYRSRYNLPHRGSKGAWRNGRLHAHDMGDHYAVHLDKVDPRKHSMWHLVADAPLLLFLWVGFLNSILTARDALREGMEIGAGKDNNAWVVRAMGGTLMVFAGTWLILEPGLGLVSVMMLIPVAMVGLGALLVLDGMVKVNDQRPLSRVAFGLAAVSIGVLLFFLAALVFVLLMFGLCLWTLATGIYNLTRRRCRGSLLRERLAQIGTGSLSLGVAVALFVEPDLTVRSIMMVLGLLCMFIGATRMISGLVLRQVVRDRPCPGEGDP